MASGSSAAERAYVPHVRNGQAGVGGRETQPRVSRGVRWAAHGAVLAVLPSGLWRVAIALGWDSGFRDGVLDPEFFPGVESFYLVGLSLFAEALALLTLGLVRRWGEMLPEWVPWLGGRRIPAVAAAAAGGLGAAAVTVVTWSMAFSWDAEMSTQGAPSGGKAVVMTACYAPLLLWGPLLAVVTVAYWRRRRRGAGEEVARG
ncbi:hypothetical protein ACH4SP_13040 [Streptomyces sp. NPDC021093]|uniref:hypothetical protein n=1 Tax=Streptomyces sp. NPDC021093 TaxID=3365112 RepID=UPI0037B353E6